MASVEINETQMTPISLALVLFSLVLLLSLTLSRASVARENGRM